MAWARDGHRVLGDDLVLLAPSARVRGFPRLGKIHRSRLGAFGLGVGDTVAPSDGDAETWLDLHRWRPFPGGTHPVVLVARVAYDASAGGQRVTPIDTRTVLRELLDHQLKTGLQQAEALDPLIEVAESVSAIELRFDDAHRASRVLLRLAEQDAA